MLDITAISKTFHPGTPNARQALRQLSLHLEDGEFATIVGSNGAGKSTLFGAIAGSFYTDEGHILLDGTDLTFQPEHQRSRVIGRLFQDPMRGTAPHMTIEENLALAYLRAGTAPNAIFSRISRKDKEIFREKLALLMATMVPPKLLLLDEHTAALDPATADKVLELTRRIVAEHRITCLMVTHNMAQALSLGSRTLMMAEGSIVLDVSGTEREGLTVNDLLERFRSGAGHALDNDRILLA